MTPPLVRMSGIVRRFDGVTALDGGELEILPGEVHGVLGENGAGKTTLLNVLAGMIPPDDGLVEVGGRPVALRTPRDAWRHGIAMVHQHFRLVPALTALENLSLGLRSDGRGWRLPYADVRRRVAAIAATTGLHVELDRPVADLGVGERQRVEIVKALLRSPRILILDEPTAVLTPGETEALFSLLRALSAEGRAVVLVAHKLDEVLSVCDRLTVLRGGRTVLGGVGPGLDADALIAAMVGAPGGTAGSPDPAGLAGGPGRRPGGVVAEIHEAGVRRADGAWAFRDASLTVRRGEVVGIAGVEGNGQRELAAVLSGRIRPIEGWVRLPSGTGFVPQDRTTEGLIGAFDLVENVALAQHDRLGRGPLMPWAELRRRAEDLRRRLGVRTPGVRVPVSSLSGGNQQRVVVGREFEIATDLLVAENPTRGLDVAGTAFVRSEVTRLVSAGDSPPGVLLVSSDLDEVLALSDRVYVMIRGRLVPVPEDRRTPQAVGELMLGGGRAA